MTVKQFLESFYFSSCDVWVWANNMSFPESYNKRDAIRFFGDYIIKSWYTDTLDCEDGTLLTEINISV